MHADERQHAQPVDAVVVRCTGRCLRASRTRPPRWPACGRTDAHARGFPGRTRWCARRRFGMPGGARRCPSPAASRPTRTAAARSSAVARRSPTTRRPRARSGRTPTTRRTRRSSSGGRYSATGRWPAPCRGWRDLPRSESTGGRPAPRSRGRSPASTRPTARPFHGTGRATAATSGGDTDRSQQRLPAEHQVGALPGKARLVAVADVAVAVVFGRTPVAPTPDVAGQAQRPRAAVGTTISPRAGRTRA